MIFQHSRFQIWNQNQHPFVHSVSDFMYSNAAIPGGIVTDMQGAMDWVFAVLYPQTKDAVATTAALPTVGNVQNDYRVVQDDGDGKAASYRWEKREGEAVFSWHKIYDMDWGSDSILTAFLLKTQDIYVKSQGYDDLDASGVAITGGFAGQRIYGGASANTNLTLSANSGDGTGSPTGFVQFTDQVRPTTDNAFDFGTTALRWKKAWLNSAQISTMLLGTGSITDTSGAITFGSANLTTAGFIKTGTMTLSSGSIIDTSGLIDFGASALTTTGVVEADSFSAPAIGSTFAAGTVIGNMTFFANGIVSSTGNIAFGGGNLITLNSVTATTLTGTATNGGNLRLAANTLSSTNTNGNIILLPNGTGIIDAQKAMTTLGIAATGSITATVNVDGGSLRLSSNILSPTTANTDVKIAPTGSGAVLLGANSRPDSDNVFSIGTSADRWTTAYLSTGIGDGTTVISSATIQSFRDANVSVTAGMTLFWSGTKWVPSLPDTEISHGTISGLSADDHTQYALLAGRSGGQSLIGGTLASNNLALSSTSNATKGNLTTDSIFRATGDGTIDLGTASFNWKDFYVTGQLIGARLQNATTAGRPSASAGTKGRMIYDTDLEDAFIDRGGTWKKLSVEKYVTQDATGWTGTETTATYTVSSEVSDARECVWAFKDNTGTFEQMAVQITMTQTTVTVTADVALPSGTYTLVGIG